MNKSLNHSFCYRYAVALLLLALLFPTSLLGQKHKYREWGEVGNIDHNLTQVPYDTAASAVVLFDRAFYFADAYDGVTIKRHRRVKILKDGAKDLGNYVFKYYSKDGSTIVSSIRGQTLLDDGNGRFTTVEVKSSDIYRKDIDNDFSSISFAFPSVKKGAIIEYELVTSSKGVYMPQPWYFQDYIPTLYSELQFTNSKDLMYVFLQEGKKLCSKYNKIENQVWVLEDMPAVENDEYNPCVRDYLEKMTIQLKETSYGAPRISDWKNACFELLSNYKEYLKESSTLKEYLAGIVGNKKDTLEIIKAIYSNVAQKYSLTDDDMIFTDQSRTKFMEKRTGSNVEKNLFLIGLLRAAGFEADPILLSTRDNGRVYTETPILRQYNHVIAAVALGGKTLFLDAATKGRGYSYIDKNSIGCIGYRISKKNPCWIDITSTGKTSTRIANQLDLRGKVPTGKMKIYYSGYQALENRQNIASMKESEYKSKLENMLGVNIDSMGVQNLDSLDLDLVISISYSYLDYNTNATLVSLPSMMVIPYAKNPFLAKERYSPVILKYPYSFSYVSSIILPEGFKLDEGLQDSKHGITPVDTFTMFTKYNPDLNNVQVDCKLKLGSYIFQPDRYAVLQNFFMNITDKSTRMIILSKKQ